MLFGGSSPVVEEKKKGCGDYLEGGWKNGRDGESDLH